MSFIGRWEGSGYGEVDTALWEGDELVVSANNGSVIISYVEDEDGGSSSRGLFKWW